MGGRIALLIGTGSFRDASLQELDAPAFDVRALAALLRDPYVAGFDPVIELVDASTQQVGREIAHTLERRRKDDLVLVYYSGRVLLDDEGQLHLAMVDTELDLLSPTSISAAFVAGEMDRCRSRRQLLILNGRAGTGFAHGVKAGMNDITAPVPKLTLPDSGELARAFLGDGYGRAVIAACEEPSHGPPRGSWPPPRASQPDLHPTNCPNSWFTHGLLEGLRGAADTDRDGRISLDELYGYAHASFVQYLPGSPPSRLGELAGDLLIGYSPTRQSTPPKSTASMRVPKPGGLVSDRYRILAALDEGGGSMFGGVDERSGRKVSIKCLRPPQSIDANALERFLREAQMAGAIDHPNVVAIYDVGFEGNSAFIVMEPLEGESLGALLRRRSRLEIAEVLDVLLPALGAVEAAHRHGVIHRALHPENIFINRQADGAIAGIKVLGFGVSTALDAGAKKARGGALIGSPHYMAPEQVLGNTAVDLRTDVYAFGVMLYEALTGQRPFEADNLGAVLWKLGNGETNAPRTLRPELPAGLEAIVLKAMAKDPAERYGQLDELRLALEAAAREHGVSIAAEPLPLAAAMVPVHHGESIQPTEQRIDPARRKGQQAAGSRNWAYALSLAVVLAGTAGWLLSDGELVGEAPPEVVPIPQAAAATQPPPTAAPPAAPEAAPAAPEPAVPEPAAERVSGAEPGPAAEPEPAPEPPAPPAPAAGTEPTRAIAEPSDSPRPGLLGAPDREVDAGYLDPVPRSAARASRLSREARAAKRRELEQQKTPVSADAGAPLLIKRLPEPGEAAELPISAPGR